MSRVISEQALDVELVLISTEGRRAMDVLHVIRGGAKLSETDEDALKADLERVLEADRMKLIKCDRPPEHGRRCAGYARAS